MIKIEKYCKAKKGEWDDFVSHSKNGTFLFYRDYMEYHSDRFVDYSLMIYAKNKLVALFPANIVEDTMYSHQGLTFGGLLLKKNELTEKTITYFNHINQYLSENNITKVCLKLIPQIYKTELSDEEEYFMYRVKGELIYRNLSSVIDLKKSIHFSRNRKRNYQKAVDHNLELLLSDDLEIFWKIMEYNMKTRFNTTPTHTCEEMKHLYQLFPQNIKLYLVFHEKKAIAGGLIYLFKNVLKIQYAHASDEGKALGAIDFLYFSLIQHYKDKLSYLDFGTSNTNNGNTINIGLLSQKEGFGGRPTVFDCYRYSTNQIIK